MVHQFSRASETSFSAHLLGVSNHGALHDTFAVQPSLGDISVQRWIPDGSTANFGAKHQWSLPDLLTNGDMVWFTEENDEKERQWLVDVTQVAAIAEPWREAVVPAVVDDPLSKSHGAATPRSVTT